MGRRWAPFLGGNIFYQSSENTTFTNSVLLASDFEIASYSTLDLRAGVRSEAGKWQLTAYGRDGTDKAYTASITSYLNTRFRLTAQPASDRVSLVMNFD